MSKIATEVTANTSQATAALDKISKQIDQLAKGGSKFRTITESVSAFGGAVSTVSGFVSKLVNTGTQLVSEYSSAAKQTITMQATLKALGDSCSVTSSDILDMADSFSKMTTFDDDAIVGVEQLLVSTKSLGKDGLQQATGLALDMATALGTDAKNAASNLARVLQDPAKNLNSLKTANIQFTESETEQIKKLQESNKLWDAQKIVLEKVENVYGGVAKAVGDTDIGKLDKVSTAMGNLRESLGRTLVNVISPYLDSIYNSIVRLQNWIDRHSSQMEIEGALANGESLDSQSPDDIKVALEKWEKIRDEAKGGVKFELSGDAIDPREAARVYGKDAGAQEVQDYDDYQLATENIQRLNEALERLNAPNPGVNDSAPVAVESSDTPASTESWLSAHGGLSKSYQIDQLREQYHQAVIEWGKAEYGSEDKQYKKEIKDALKKRLDEMLSSDVVVEAAEEVSANPNPVADFISANSGKSASYQLDQLNGQISEARMYRELARMDGSDDEAKYLDEIIAKLDDEKDKLEDVGDKIDDNGNKWEKTWSKASQFVSQAQQMWSAFAELGMQTLNQNVDAARSELDKTKAAWDEYFDHLEDRQEAQQQGLAVMYEQGLMSAEDYVAALNSLDEDRTESEQKRQEQEEELQAKADSEKKKAFEANKLNQVAQVLVSGATAAAGVWANPGWPAAIPLTVMLAAMNTAQIATIMSQKYTPMAVGGIVTQPTHAYIGEGAEPEAVLPLSKLKSDFRPAEQDRQGVNITLNIGDGYTSDEIAEKVYRSISNLQRGGVLPAWA